MNTTHAVSHTPGPWAISTDNTPWTEGDAEIAHANGEPFGLTLILTDILDADGEVVARCEWEPGSTVERQAELEANARLIAAAPEMLEALRALVEEHFAPRYGTGEKRAADWERARAAITKAEGR